MIKTLICGEGREDALTGSTIIRKSEAKIVETKMFPYLILTLIVVLIVLVQLQLLVVN